MSRSLSLAILATVALVTACSEKPQTALSPRPQFSLVVPGGSCALDPWEVDQAIASLFLNSGARTQATTEFDGAVTALIQPDSAAARAHVMNLVALVIHGYQKDSLGGGQTATTRAAAADLINVALCYVGLPTMFSADALSGDGAAGVVGPSDTVSTIVNDLLVAGIQVPAGGVTEPVIVTIVRLPDTPGPLLTQLDQYPIYYEFHVTPEGALAAPAVVGVCVAGDVTPPDLTRLRVGHNVAPFTMGSIEILPLQPAPFLDCSNVATALAPSGNRLLDFARAGWRRVGPVLASILSPQRLNAAPLFATSGVGGTTKTFSPFGIVDTLVVMTANSSTSQTAPAGTAVAAPPSVTLRTPNGHLFSGLPVNFAVTAGGGAVTGALTTTDLSGVATAGSWTLGLAPGTNTVDATATPPHLGSGVLGSPLTFSATGVGAAVELAACAPGEGAGDEVTRAFYHPRFPGSTLKQVTLYLSSNARANRSATYGIQLEARSGGFHGPVIGTSTATVALRGTPSENRAVSFDFVGEPAVQHNDIVTFQFNVLSNPTGAKLYFNVGRGGDDEHDDDHRRGGRCPLIETKDASGSLSAFRHQGVAARIVGAR